jgi:hypothetical protein
MPPAGSQPRLTAKSMIKRIASQNGGTEMPAKAIMLIRLSKAERGRTAATMPAGKAIARARAKLRPIKSSVLPSLGRRISSTGRAWSREKPRSPESAAVSQRQ